MGSPCELKLCSQNQNLQQISRQVIAKIQSLEDRYTRFKPGSITSEINQHAGTGAAIEVDQETACLLDYAALLYQQSDGLFDITSGVLRRVWDFHSNTLPSQQQIDTALSLIGWNNVILCCGSR